MQGANWILFKMLTLVLSSPIHTQSQPLEAIWGSVLTATGLGKLTTLQLQDDRLYHLNHSRPHIVPANYQRVNIVIAMISAC